MINNGESKFMDAEEELRRAKHKCLLWVKGLHNIQRSRQFMKRFAEKANSQDHLTKEALFQAAVVSYAKPFTDTETEDGKVILSLKPFKGIPSFEVDTHTHIITLRKKLIAHDDLTEIGPKYVWLSLVDNSDTNGVLVPFQAYLRNSCVSYPQNRGDFEKMHAHIRAACDGALRYLDQRVIETRKLMLAHPKEAQSVFQERPDSVLGIITGDGKTAELKMDISAVETHPRVEVSTPHTHTSFGDYRHTTINVRIFFQRTSRGGSWW